MRKIKSGAAMIAALALAACAPDTRSYYKNFVSDLKADGKLRTAVAPKDAPFTNEDLARNFIEVALYSEFNDGEEAARTPTTLSKWAEPVSYKFFGTEITGNDKRIVRDLTQRVSRLTGLEIKQTDDDANMLIFLLNEEERGVYLEAFEKKFGEDGVKFQRLWTNNVTYPCVAQFYENEDGTGISFAMVLVKAELEGVFRKSCFHEEIVQSFGLLNDGYDIRPSLFNDDEEFALMTRHDEYLLQMLYDPRLTNGMTRTEVEALARTIINEIRPEGGA